MIAELRPDDPILLFHLYIMQKVKKQDGVKSSVLERHLQFQYYHIKKKKRYYQQQAVQDYWLYFQFSAASYHSRHNFQRYLPGGSKLIAVK